MTEKIDNLFDEWVAFAKNPDFNLVEKCLKLSQVVKYPDLAINRYIEKLNELGKTLKDSITEVKNPTYLISMLNECFFDRFGFHGDEEDYYDPKNNFLNEVLDKKSGLPLTLSIIYSELAKHIGLDLKIVGFPSHVLVKFGEEMILDPFYGGRLVSSEDLQQILDRSFNGQVKFSPEFLNEISTEKILIRLSRNLKHSYLQSYAYEKAMLSTEMVLRFEPGSAEEIRDKGIIYGRMGNYDSALKYLNKYLEINPNSEDVDFILDLIKSIRKKVNQ